MTPCPSILINSMNVQVSVVMIKSLKDLFVFLSKLFLEFVFLHLSMAYPYVFLIYCFCLERAFEVVRRVNKWAGRF